MSDLGPEIYDYGSPSVPKNIERALRRHPPGKCEYCGLAIQWDVYRGKYLEELDGLGVCWDSPEGSSRLHSKAAITP